MHPTITMMNWSHHMHDSWLFAWHEIIQIIQSRTFWVATFLAVGFFALLVTFITYAPGEVGGTMTYGLPSGFPIAPYLP
jgi:hypothetical protein